MSVTLADVRHIAALARLRFDDEALEPLVADLNSILGYMDKLAELDIDGVEPTAHVLDLVNVTRPDAVQPRITKADALRNAPSADSDYVRVPKVID